MKSSQTVNQRPNGIGLSFSNKPKKKKKLVLSANSVASTSAITNRKTGQLSKTLSPIVSKRIVIYKNGDAFDKGLKVAVNTRHVNSVQSLLDVVNEKIGLVNGAKKLYTLSGQIVKTIDVLEDGKEYVAASRIFTPLPYGRAAKRKEQFRLHPSIQLEQFGKRGSRSVEPRKSKTEVRPPRGTSVTPRREIHLDTFRRINSHSKNDYNLKVNGVGISASNNSDKPKLKRELQSKRPNKMIEQNSGKPSQIIKQKTTPLRTSLKNARTSKINKLPKNSQKAATKSSSNSSLKQTQAHQPNRLPTTKGESRSSSIRSISPTHSNLEAERSSRKSSHHSSQTPTSKLKEDQKTENFDSETEQSDSLSEQHTKRSSGNEGKRESLVDKKKSTEKTSNVSDSSTSDDDTSNNSNSESESSSTVSSKTKSNETKSENSSISDSKSESETTASEEDSGKNSNEKKKLKK